MTTTVQANLCTFAVCVFCHISVAYGKYLFLQRVLVSMVQVANLTAVLR